MKKRKKILLITPPYHSGVVESAGVWLNLAFVYLAGSLRVKGYEPIIYDAMSYWHGYEEIEKKILEVDPDGVITTAITAAIVDALKVLKLAKRINPKIVTVIGNVHPTFCYEEILREHHEYVDYIVRGEGEVTLVELLEAVFNGGDVSKVKGIAYWEEGGVKVTPDRELITDLDNLPTAWDLVDWSVYTYKPVEGSVFAVVSSSRGCSHHCAFCSQQLFWKRRWRARSPENFVNELIYLREKFGVNVVMISDETPTLSRERWERILDLKIEKGLDTIILMETRVSDILRDRDIMWKYRKAGVEHIYVGVESVSQSTLELFKKNIRVEESKQALDIINEHDIISETSFVLGMPDDTKETIKNCVELAKYYNPDLAFFLAITPWPYAEIYSELKPYIEIWDYSKYNLVEPVVRTKEMSREELKEELFKATMEFYMHKMKSFGSMSSFKREFMIKVMRILATDSYLSQTMKEIVVKKIKKFIKPK
jgi:anaerobic magnesium-protoporphyrin IX monomethyl ester cyclase